MSQDTTIEYKLRLAHDLILFLTSSYLQRVPQEQKAEGVNTILQSWEERVEALLQQQRADIIKEAVKENDVDEDVQTILANIHCMEPLAIRKEFKAEIKDNLLKILTKANQQPT